MVLAVHTVFTWKENKTFVVEKGKEINFSLLTDDFVKDSLRINFNFPNYGSSRENSKMKSNMYSLRDGISSHEKDVKISSKGSVPLLVYSLPYEDPK